MPGTELKQLLLSLRIRPKGTCDCLATLKWMDRLGIDGCKRDRHLLIPRLRENAKEYGVIDWMKAAFPALKQGLRINAFNPFPGLFDEAVRRAEEKQRTHESYGI